MTDPVCPIENDNIPVTEDTFPRYDGIVGSAKLPG